MCIYIYEYILIYLCVYTYTLLANEAFGAADFLLPQVSYTHINVYKWICIYAHIYTHIYYMYVNVYIYIYIYILSPRA